jgi:hypothetical protein
MRSPPILGALCGALLALAPALGPGIAGSAGPFPTEIEAGAGADKIKLVQTGNAIRYKAFIKVYAVASYLEK